MRTDSRLLRIGFLFAKVIGLYLILTAVLSLGMWDISPRHTLFLLVDSILFWGIVTLFEEKRGYIRSIFFFLAILCSIFLIRALTPNVMKVFDVYLYFSFAFAVANIGIFISAICPRGGRRVLTALWSFLISLPILLCWGFYFSEHAWLDVQAVFAILQTNPQETLNYLRDRTGSFVLIGLLLEAAYIYSAVKLTQNLVLKKKRAVYIGGVILVLLNIVLLMRTHHNFLTDIGYDTRSYQAFYNEFAQETAERAASLQNLNTITAEDGPGVYVLVIGESETRDHMSAYGYEEETTPWLTSMQAAGNYLQFQHAYSNYVATVQALSYALTQKNQYNDRELSTAASILDVAKAAGYQTVWISNQTQYGTWDNPLSVLASAADQQIFINRHINSFSTDFYDGELANQLAEIQKSDRMLIVIHLMGNHVSYKEHYPAEYDAFHGNGKTSEYDNSVLYNDAVMQKIYGSAEVIPHFAGLIYFSDHGEAIDRDASHSAGRFGYDMTRIPLYMIFSPTYMEKHPDKIKTLRQATGNYFTNDLIYNTLLGIMGIRDGEDEPENDLSNQAYNADIYRFKTLWGEKPIVDDPEFSK